MVCKESIDGLIRKESIVGLIRKESIVNGILVRVCLTIMEAVVTAVLKLVINERKVFKLYSPIVHISMLHHCVK
jgi:hypothetical protein